MSGVIPHVIGQVWMSCKHTFNNLVILESLYGTCWHCERRCEADTILNSNPLGQHLSLGITHLTKYHSHSPTHPHPHSPTHPHTLTHPPTFTLSLTPTHSPSPSLTHPPSHPHSPTHLHTLTHTHPPLHMSASHSPHYPSPVPFSWDPPVH